MRSKVYGFDRIADFEEHALLVKMCRLHFVDYHLKERVAHRPNWVIDVMPTGAFPHFVKLELLAESYAVFTSELP
jgi:hypothetical protein